MLGSMLHLQIEIYLSQNAPVIKVIPKVVWTLYAATGMRGFPLQFIGV